MIHVNRNFFVRAEAVKAMDFIKDFSNAEEWDPGTQRCVRLDSGEIGVGSRWHNESKLLFITTELEYELTELTATRAVFCGENSSATSVDDITIKPEGAGARVTYDAQVTFKGFAKIGEPLMHLIFQKLARDTVKQMTEALESL
jgi:hypothetical protein